MYKVVSPLSIVCLFLPIVQLAYSQTDADLAAFWDFESGRTDTDVWVTHLHGSDTVYGSSNCYDVIGGVSILSAKNDFFMSKFGSPTISVASVQEEGIPSFGGRNVLKTTVFNDEQAYLDWGATYYDPDPQPHNANVKARVDPAVPMGHFRMTDGDEAWFGFALYIPEDYVWESSISWGTQSIMELQYREDIPAGKSSSGGPFAISIGNAELEIKTVYSPTHHPRDSTSTIKRNYPLQKGVWYSIVCHVKYDFTANGIAEVWVNGDKAMDLHGIRLGYAGMQNAAAALDVLTAYQHNWFLDPSNVGHSGISPSEQFERTLYFDSLRVAKVNSGSFEEVDPAQDLGLDYGQFALDAFGDEVARVGATDDFDKDGTVNFLEYLLGTDPTEGRIESVLGMEIVDGQAVLEWTQRRRVRGSELKLQLATEEAKEWEGLPDGDYFASFVPLEGGDLEKVRFVLSADLSGAVLFRLAAELPL